jgi:acyl-CoA reductase-like NAD-dependent aldehyde dehydrogenase
MHGVILMQEVAILTYRLLIGGQMVDGDRSMDVINPATGEVLADCPRASVRQLDEAVDAAKLAAPLWGATPIGKRRSMLEAIAERLDANEAELAHLLTLENGKPLPDATNEVRYSVMFLRYFAGLDLATRRVSKTFGGEAEILRRPLGVVGAIIPWNFPILIVAFKVPLALLAGNSVVIKPAPTTPLTMLRIGELINDIVPPGVLNIIADDNDLGAALAAHPDVAKITFTGSVATGRRVMESAASTLKRLTLELGGNDAAIVLDDVDCEAVAGQLFNCAFQNSGQVCLAIKRLYVHDAVYDDICDALDVLANRAVVGDGLKQGVTHGPIQNRTQFERVKALLADAQANGNVTSGGLCGDMPGYFVRPTIVRDVAEGTRIVDEEQFGPILPVIRFHDPEDALLRANGSEFGLGGSVWSSDPDRAYALASRLQAGTVWVNTHAGMSPDVPFGGAKQSGIGVEFGEEGLHEFTQVQSIHLSTS